MREELVSRSRTLKAASRAMRQAFSARRARSSREPALLAARLLFTVVSAFWVLAAEGLLFSVISAASADVRAETLPGMLMGDQRRSPTKIVCLTGAQGSVIQNCERMNKSITRDRQSCVNLQAFECEVQGL